MTYIEHLDDSEGQFWEKLPNKNHYPREDFS